MIGGSVHVPEEAGEAGDDEERCQQQDWPATRDGDRGHVGVSSDPARAVWLKVGVGRKKSTKNGCQVKRVKATFWRE